ncbi:hypothetical protein C1646_757094 [Rhizophagus diaphanus]|nr:hypothetical protein C1646_757094 [Rhizophagus diaphanus] [Rhizophagus sp. MUCL 43196]
MRNKMTGRFAPVPANDPYAGDTPDSYEKRIKPLVQAMQDADALPYLFNHLPSDLEMRLRNKWYETRDLAYTGIATDDATLEKFIYDDLQRRSAYATKKVVRKVVPKVSAKQTRHCSACGKAGHTKVNCPKGKRTKKVNYVYQDEVEDAEASEEEYIVEEVEDSEEEEIEDDDEYIRKQETAKKLPTSKSRKTSGNIYMITDQVKQIVLKSIISSLVPYCPKEILVEISKFINIIYPKLKDPSLNSLMENDTVKRREIVWKNVTIYVQDVLFPLMQATNVEQKLLLQVPENNESVQSANEDIVMADSTKIKEINNISTSYVLPENNRLEHAIKAYASAQKKNSQIYWPKPLEINFLQIKDADDVATIYCKIGGLVIPCAMIDTGSDSSIFSDNIAELVEELLGIKINRKKVHRLNGVASQSISIGTMDNVPITIGSGENTATITDEFSVVPAEKDQNGNAKSLVILGTQWQYRAGWEPLIKGEFKATCNGKTITIPLSVHKSQRNVFTVGKEPEPIKKN